MLAPVGFGLARVWVNRAWERFFGQGLVRTTENFGSQAEWPSHPDLLDWLAVDFMENGWSQKRLVRALVTSRTYQQSSRATSAQLERDPRNLYLARGPRFRLPAMFLRDTALAASGLYAPEYQILNDTTAISLPNQLWNFIYANRSTTNTIDTTVGIRLDSLLPLARTPAALVERVTARTLSAGAGA